MKSGSSLDERDRQILTLLQQNADYPISKMASLLHLSESACWRRIKRLEEDEFIARRVVLLNRARMHLPTTVYVFVKTSNHSMEWLEQFRSLVSEIPEITECHRLTGDVDYLMKIVLPNVEHWDNIYKKLVGGLRFFNISSYISMEEIKATTAIPAGYI